MGRKRKLKPNFLNRKITGLWFTIMILFIGELFIYTWYRVQSVQMGYEITKAYDDQRRLLAVRQNLMIELARLKSPERIERIARKQLGLTTPAPEQILVIP